MQRWQALMAALVAAPAVQTCSHIDRAYLLMAERQEEGADIKDGRPSVSKPLLCAGCQVLPV